MIRQCGGCEKPFEIPYESGTKKGRGKFCSTACFHNSTRKDPLHEFHKKYEVTEDGCWKWIGKTRGKGYGVLTMSGGIVAHRFSLQLATGLSGEGLFACHHCDNPSCVNPDHLFWGTHTDNVRDCVSKGRHGKFWSSRTHCKNGHEYTPENTRITKTQRVCRACVNASGKRIRERDPEKTALRHKIYNRDKATKRRAKLGEADVLAIRAADQDASVLAAIYGVHPTTIKQVKRRDTWRHI